MCEYTYVSVLMWFEWKPLGMGVDVLGVKGCGWVGGWVGGWVSAFWTSGIIILRVSTVCFNSLWSKSRLRKFLEKHSSNVFVLFESP